jgi:hypothetical protein
MNRKKLLSTLILSSGLQLGCHQNNDTGGMI